jgi:hypothetical protein
MRYLLLCCFDEKRWEQLSGSQRGEIMREYGELMQSLDRSGSHLASAQLLPSSTARTVRAMDRKPVVTDGPYAETKEQLGGYHLIECASADEALAIAKRIPPLGYGGAVEVRALAPARSVQGDASPPVEDAR